MKLIQLEQKNYDKIDGLFDSCHDTTCWTVLQGIGGEVWCDNRENPAYAIATYGDFGFMAGCPDKNVLSEIMKEILRWKWIIWIPLTESWKIKLDMSKEFVRKSRYAIEKKQEPFDRVLLLKYVNEINPKYTIKPITQEIGQRVLGEEWSKDFCSNYKSMEDYMKHGLGFVIMEGEMVIAGASSYSYYDKGIEIEIATRKQYRRKGLATAIGAKLILECMERGLYPSWDAANKESVKTAEKLGYRFLEEYSIYIGKAKEQEPKR